MKMSVELLKQISLFSIIIGLGVGLISHIPFIGSLVFVMYFLLIAGGLIIYFKRKNIIGAITVKEGGVLGAVIGMASMLGVYVSYTPILLIIALINPNYNPLVANLILYGFMSPLNFFALIFLLFLGCLLCGLMNCFGGGAIAYVYEFLANLDQ